MHHQQADPPAALQAIIKDFWYLRRDFDVRQLSFEVAPDGYMELIFTFGSPYCVATPAGWQLLPSPFLVGLLPQPLRFQALGRLEIVGIKCFPRHSAVHSLLLRRSLAPSATKEYFASSAATGLLEVLEGVN